MEECTEAEVQRLLPLVPQWRREQALRYRHVFGQYCCLKSWTMLQNISETAQSPNCEVTYNEYGKPFFSSPSEGGLRGSHFSISHCKAGIAVAVDDQPIGIDIEALDRRPLFQPEDGSDFFEWWTRMEAIVKMRGTGITDDWRSTHLEEGEMVETFRPEGKNYIYSVARQEK